MDHFTFVSSQGTMSTHLAHKLPWASLSEVAVNKAYGGDLYEVKQNHLHAARHFARCFKAALTEFAATDTTEEHDLDPTTWGIERSGQGYMGWRCSLIDGYVALNLILAEPAHANALHALNWHPIGVLCGRHDGGHPDHMAKRLQGAFREDYHLKPLTADVMQILRTHAALLFKCMYKIRGENPYLSRSDDDLGNDIFAFAVGYLLYDD